MIERFGRSTDKRIDRRIRTTRFLIVNKYLKDEYGHNEMILKQC